MPVHRHRVVWIDVARGIAAIAVVYDHAIYLLLPDYGASLFWRHLFFAVPWFIFLFGLTSVLSIRQTPSKGPSTILRYWQKRAGLFVWYIAASLIAEAVGRQSLPAILHDLLTFSASAPYYFFFLLLQYVFLFPFLYMFVKNRSYGAGIALAALSVWLSLWSAKFTRDPYITVPYRTVYGGWFGSIFTAGILYGVFERELKKIIPAAAVVLTVVLEWKFVATPFSAYVFGLLPWYTYGLGLPLLFTAKLVIDAASKWVSLAPVAFIGRRSMFIFLFHFLFLQLLPVSYMQSWGILLTGIIVIVLSCIAQEAVTAGRTVIVWAVRNVRT